MTENITFQHTLLNISNGNATLKYVPPPKTYRVLMLVIPIK